jgi:hypothetical protein
VAVKVRATWFIQKCLSLKILLNCQTRWRRLFSLGTLYLKQILKHKSHLRIVILTTWTLLRSSSWSVTCLWWAMMKILTTSKKQRRNSWLRKRSSNETRCFLPSS